MERTIAEELNDKFVPTEEVTETIQQEQKTGLDLSILKSPTGVGSVGDYLEHPMNFNKSQGMARILRGLTGILGNLDLAIIDIAVGLLDLLKTNKKGTITNGANTF